jgi:hypothetical protein
MPVHTLDPLMIVPDADGEFGPSLAALQTAGPDLYRALVGPDHLDSGCRFSWVTTLVAELTDKLQDDPDFREAWEGDDPLSASECLAEVQILIREVRAAIAKAEGASQPGD